MSRHITITRSEAYDLCNALAFLELYFERVANAIDDDPDMQQSHLRQQAKVEAQRLALLEKLEGENS